MSRHHVTLPPIVYTPVPKPKVARRRPAVGRLASRSAGAAAQTEETESVVVRSDRMVTAVQGRPDQPNGSDGGGRPAVSGRLGEVTLRALLEAQEQTR